MSIMSRYSGVDLQSSTQPQLVIADDIRFGGNGDFFGSGERDHENCMDLLSVRVTILR